MIAKHWMNIQREVEIPDDLTEAAKTWDVLVREHDGTTYVYVDDKGKMFRQR